MKPKLLTLSLLLMSIITMSAAKVKKPSIERIDPAFWYVGMKNPSLQLMLSGPGIASVSDVTTDYPGVRIDSVVRLDSPNYLFLYINVREAKAGTMTLKWKEEKGKWKEVAYELRQREMAGEERRGFDISDVLYLVMPDRFAQGLDHSRPIAGMNSYREDRSQPSLRHGGDMEGIRQHLDYFTDLGVTALWFTPVLENNSPDSDNGYSTYHGYATTDYYRVDPRFGTNDDYRRLIDDCHKRGLKVVMDMIFNKPIPPPLGRGWGWVYPHQLQADARARPIRIGSGSARDHRGMVRALDARPQPA